MSRLLTLLVASDTSRMICSKAAVSSACFWVCNAIFSLNFLGFAMMAAVVLTCKARQIANENLLTQISTPSVGTGCWTWPTLIQWLWYMDQCSDRNVLLSKLLLTKEHITFNVTVGYTTLHVRYTSQFLYKFRVVTITLHYVYYIELNYRVVKIWVIVTDYIKYTIPSPVFNHKQH